MLVNVCVDNIFWTAKHFVTKLGMVMQHHEPVSCGKKLFAVLKVIVTARRSRSQQGLIWLFLLYPLNWRFFGNQTLSDDTLSWVSVLWKKNWITAFKVKVTVKDQNACPDDLNCLTFCYQTWYCDASPQAGVHAKRLVCYFEGQGHGKGAYDQNMTVSSISAELLILFLPNLVWWYIIISQNFLQKMGLLCSRSRSQRISKC